MEISYKVCVLSTVIDKGEITLDESKVWETYLAELIKRLTTEFGTWARIELEITHPK